jgi:hypothetical protein
MKGIGKILILVIVIAVGAAAIYLVAANGGKKVTPPAATTTEPEETKEPEETVATPGGEQVKPVVTGPQPNIEFEEAVFDWGQVYQDAKVIHIFKFKNTGEADLVIDKVKSG